MKMAGMASSSKRQGSSIKQARAGKARTISAPRKDTLPRKAGVSAARRKPAAQPPLEAPADSLAAVLAVAKPKRTAARKSAPRKKSAAPQAEIEVEASAIVEEATIEAGSVPSADSQLEQPPTFEAAAEPPPALAIAAPAPVAAPVPHEGKRALITAVARLLSILGRWAGLRK